MEENLRIEIEDKDIIGAHPEYGPNPIEVVLEKHFNTKYMPRVNHTSEVEIIDPNGEMVDIISLPEEAVRFDWKFTGGEPVSPFCFYLPVPIRYIEF